jgi:hypothetical protein
MTTLKAQDKWSEITYFRRYNLLSLLDLEVEDDDWKKAQDSKPTKWYNDFEKHKDNMIDKIASWETTQEWIINDLEAKWYTLSKKTKEDIISLIK